MLSCLLSGLRLAEQLGRREDEAKIRHGLGLSLWASGNLEEAQHQVCRAVFQELKHPPRLARQLWSSRGAGLSTRLTPPEPQPVQPESCQDSLTHGADLLISQIPVLYTVAMVTIKPHLFLSGEVRSGCVAIELTVLGGL